MRASYISKCHHFGKTNPHAFFDWLASGKKQDTRRLAIGLSVDWIRTPDNQRAVGESIKCREDDYKD
ncbi:hypothetical protein EMIT0P100_20792 [Pseudomonas sp. IT-P100]